MLRTLIRLVFGLPRPEETARQPSPLQVEVPRPPSPPSFPEEARGCKFFEVILPDQNDGMGGPRELVFVYADHGKNKDELMEYLVGKQQGVMGTDSGVGVVEVPAREVDLRGRKRSLISYEQFLERFK